MESNNDMLEICADLCTALQCTLAYISAH